MSDNLHSLTSSMPIINIVAHYLNKNHHIPARLDLEAHVHASVQWILRAQAASNDGGISASYKVIPGKWTCSYPETTGYTIPTLIDYTKRYHDEKVKEAVIRMAEYELSMQVTNGGFPGLQEKPGGPIKPIGFDTGQVIFGLIAMYQETKQSRFITAATRAADWLLQNQSSDGLWEDYRSFGPLVIDARVSWALLRLYELVREDKYKDAACNQLEWVIKQQSPNGWFANCSFHPNQHPVTHTIAYVIEGLLESGLVLHEERYYSAAKIAADAILSHLKPSGFLPGTFDNQWRPASSWSCLTGNAQLANIWLRLAQQTGSQEYIDAARKALTFVAATQFLDGVNNGLRGGVAGSWPIYGDYLRLIYPNWSANFFISACLNYFSI